MRTLGFGLNDKGGLPKLGVPLEGVMGDLQGGIGFRGQGFPKSRGTHGNEGMEKNPYFNTWAWKSLVSWPSAVFIG